MTVEQAQFRHWKELHKDSLVKIKYKGREYSGKVLTADNWGHAWNEETNTNNWYIEMIDIHTGQYRYWKQVPDGGELLTVITPSGIIYQNSLGNTKWECYRGCTWQSPNGMVHKECPNCGAPDVNKA